MKEKKKLISWILIVTMIASLFTSTATVYADAKESGEPSDALRSINADLYISAQNQGVFTIPPCDATVNAAAAEDHGYADQVTDGVSVLDVMVYMHEKLYGEDFDRKLLAVNPDTGFITTMFGEDGMNTGFAVNGLQPNDGVIGPYGSYTAYTAPQAKVTDGDKVELFFYQDSWYSDNYIYFDEGEVIEANAMVPADFTVKGFNFCYYGASDKSMLDAMTQKIEDVQLAIVNPETGELTDLDGALTDENGKAHYTFKKPGEYLITGYAGEDAYVPCFMPAAKVVVGSIPEDVLNQMADFDEELTFDVGDEGVMLSSGDLEDLDVTWSSDDRDVATVDENGFVTPVDVGRTNITLTCGDVTKTCKVKVVMPSVKLSQKTLELENDETAELSATVKSSHKDAAATWTSSNKKVAAVDENGVVTGISTGTAVITASYGQGEADCFVTVKETVKAGAFSIEPADKNVVMTKQNSYGSIYNVFIGSCDKDTSFDLTAVPGAANESIKVNWSVNKSGYSVDENGTVTVPACTKGNRDYITVTAVSKFDSSVKEQYNVYILPPVAILDAYQNVEVTIPENGKINPTGTYVLASPSEYQNLKMIGWSVEDDSILSLDGESNSNVCYLIPKKAGTTTVTAYELANPENKAETTVTVKGMIVKDANGVSGKAVMNVGDSIMLTASEDGAVFTSSDEDVAEISDSGLLRAKKAGSAVITATKGDLKATYTVGVYGEGDYFFDTFFTTSYNSLYKDEKCSARIDSVSDYLGPNMTYTSTAHFFDAFNNEKQTFYMTGGTSNLSISFGAAFDDKAVKAEILKDGEVIGTIKPTITSQSSTAVAVTSGTTNDLAVKFTSLDDESKYKEYPITIIRKPCNTATLKTLTIKPSNRAAKTNIKYKAQNEGILFRADAQGNPASGTGFTANTLNYKAYLYSDVEAVSAVLAATDSVTGHVAYSADDGESWTECGSNATTDPIELSKDGKARIMVTTVGDDVYKSVTAEGGNPFDAENNANKVYTVFVERVEENATAHTKIDSISYSEGCTPSIMPFNPGLSSTAALVDHDAPSAVTVTFTADKDVQVYDTSVSAKNLLTPQSADEETGLATYKMNISVPLASSPATKSQNIYLTYSEDGKEVCRQLYTVTLLRVGTTTGVLSGTPDKVVEYLCPGSQYTNGAYQTYGLFPEKSMQNGGTWNSCISLGNFGGYITYYYENGIKNNAGNKYGIDFTVFGNSNGGASFSEPGNVLVSEDGKTWYSLAGSEHYDAAAVWDYEVTYKDNSGTTANYEDSFGASGSLGSAFAPLLFPVYDWYGSCSEGYSEDKKSVTVKGTRLLGPSVTSPEGIEMSSGGAAALPAFGYCDVHTNSSSVQGTGENVNLFYAQVGNPYVENYEAYGDGFDLEWAVDEKGMPVDVSGKEFHYVKVQTASFINAGIFGEKSTEVNSVVATASDNEDYSVTPMPKKLTVSNKEINLSKEKNVYYASTDSSEFVISVDASEDTNIYINNERTAARTFEEMPSKGIVRIILQEGVAAPRIIYVVIADENSDSVAKTMAAVDTITSETAEEAKALYDALSEREKEQLNGVTEIIEAAMSEKKISNLNELIADAEKAETIDELADIMKEYDKLSEEQKDRIEGAESLAVQAIKIIEAANEPKKEDIAAAKEIYEALSDAQKEKVNNYQSLVNAELKLANKTLAEESQKTVQEQQAAMDKLKDESEQKAREQQSAIDKLKEENKQLAQEQQSAIEQLEKKNQELENKADAAGKEAAIKNEELKKENEEIKAQNEKLTASQEVTAEQLKAQNKKLEEQIAETRFAASKANLVKKTFVYSAKAIKAKVKVTYAGKTLKKGVDYTVAYKNNKKVGKATVIITGKGKYSGTKKLTFKINPKGTKIKKVKKMKKAFKVTWEKRSTEVTGYQIRYSTKSSMKSAKVITVKGSKSTKKTVKKLKAKKKYYVQIRTYKITDRVKYYSKWSKKKTVKTK